MKNEEYGKGWAQLTAFVSDRGDINFGSIGCGHKIDCSCARDAFEKVINKQMRSKLPMVIKMRDAIWRICQAHGEWKSSEYGLKAATSGQQLADRIIEAERITRQI